MSFSSDVKRIAELIKVDQDELFQATCLDLGSKIIKRTPVDEGTARNSWFAGVNIQPTAANRRKGNKSGQQAINDLLQKISKLRAGDRFFLINRMPYIFKLEFGQYPNPPKGGKGKTANGYSKQAPRGMVRIEARKFRRLVSRLAKRISNRKVKV